MAIAERAIVGDRQAIAEDNTKDKADRDMLGHLLENLSTAERHEFHGELSRLLQALRQACHANKPEALLTVTKELDDCLTSWTMTLRLRINGEFQRQSKEYQYKSARDELDHPSGEKELKRTLRL